MVSSDLLVRWGLLEKRSVGHFLSQHSTMCNHVKFRSILFPVSVACVLNQMSDIYVGVI